MYLNLEDLSVESFTTSAAIGGGEPLPTIDTGPGGEYTLCFICTGRPSARTDCLQ